MLREILFWWVQQMRDLLPGRWFDRYGDRSGALVVAPGSDSAAFRADVTLSLRGGGKERLLGRYALDAAGFASLRQFVARRRPKRCVLLLPADELLERTVALPLAAEPDWPNVMRYEMDRLTPFAAADIFWSGVVTGRDRAQGKLELRLSLVPRVTVEPLLASLAQGGLRPDVIQANAADGKIRVIELTPAIASGTSARRRAVAGLAGVCAALALAAVALPFVTQGLALQRVEQRIAALEPTVRQTEALRTAALERAARAAGIASRRQGSGDALAVLAAVTEALPDDTFLNELTLDHGRLSMAGQSAEAARLIAVLTASMRIRNPVFSAPVTRNEVVHADLFSIRAEIGP